MERHTLAECLANTALVDDAGRRILLHHASRSEFDTSQFAPFSHFGTRKAARDRMSQTFIGPDITLECARAIHEFDRYGEIDSDTIDRLEQSMHKYPVGQDMPSLEDDPEDFEAFAEEIFKTNLVSAFLDIRNPLQISDIDDNHDHFHLVELIHEAKPGLLTISIEDAGEMEPGAVLEHIKEDLIAAGYDGLSYVNDLEDEGSTSYIILDPAQVHVVERTDLLSSIDPFDMDMEWFTGPVEIGDHYGIYGDEEDYEWIWELAKDNPESLPILQELSDGWNIRFLEDMDPFGSVTLFDPEGTCQGFYMGGQCFVNEDARGAGRGVAMIAVSAHLIGGCPTYNEEGMGFSEDGNYAHEAAWRMVVMERKAELERRQGDGYALDEKLAPWVENSCEEMSLVY